MDLSSGGVTTRFVGPYNSDKPFPKRSGFFWRRDDEEKRDERGKERGASLLGLAMRLVKALGIVEALRRVLHEK